MNWKLIFYEFEIDHVCVFSVFYIVIPFRFVLSFYHNFKFYFIKFGHKRI